MASLLCNLALYAFLDVVGVLPLVLCRMQLSKNLKLYLLQCRRRAVGGNAGGVLAPSLLLDPETISVEVLVLIETMRLGEVPWYLGAIPSKLLDPS
jgi:hypothetical protein